MIRVPAVITLQQTGPASYGFMRGRDGMPSVQGLGLTDDGSGDDSYLQDGTTILGPGLQTSGGGGGSSSSTDFWSNFASIINAGGNVASGILKATNPPYLIPGTSVLYNPATGGVTSTPGLATAQVAAGSTPLVLGLIAIAAVVVVVMASKK